MNKLKDTRVFGDLIVDDSITKNNKEVATEDYVDAKLSAKQDKLTLNSGQVLGRTTSGSGSPEAINTINISQIKVSDLDDGDSYAKTADLPTGSDSIKLSGNSFQRAALTGDVTSPQNSNVTTIANNAVTLAKIQNIPTNTVLGRTSSGTGAVQALDLVDIGEITPSSWTQIWSGSVNLNSYTSGWYTVSVPTNTYVGKRIAIEVQFGSGTTYTSKIIFGVLGSDSYVGASTTVSKGIGWNYFDGTYLRVKTLFAYTGTGTRSSIYVGHLKTLFGKFTGTTIEWKTSHSETLYMKKIWVIN